MMEKPPLPRDTILVRHGESEFNVLQRADKAGRLAEMPQELRDRPDWKHRLTNKGEGQASLAGEWITKNFRPVEQIEARYHSFYVRARSTADILAPPETLWRPHNLIHEQDWGEFGATPYAERQEKYVHTNRMKKVASLYARPDGGESYADSLTMRYRMFRDTSRRKWSDKQLIAVIHGGTATVARYVTERMLPEDWDEMMDDKTQDLGNCAIIWYTRVNPRDERDVRPYINWRLMIQPDDVDNSPFGGEWCELPDRRFMTGAELKASAEKFPRLLPPDFTL